MYHLLLLSGLLVGPSKIFGTGLFYSKLTTDLRVIHSGRNRERLNLLTIHTVGISASAVASLEHVPVVVCQ